MMSCATPVLEASRTTHKHDDPRYWDEELIPNVLARMESDARELGLM